MRKMRLMDSTMLVRRWFGTRSAVLLLVGLAAAAAPAVAQDDKAVRRPNPVFFLDEQKIRAELKTVAVADSPS